MHFDPQDLHVAALTLLGEARGESVDGRVAVAWVIRNRAEDPRWPSVPAEVCKQPYQFSCWLDKQWNLGNLHRMVHADWDDDAYREAYAVAAAVFGDLIADPTEGANHYHTQSVSPAWSSGKEPIATVGRHLFFKL